MTQRTLDTIDHVAVPVENIGIAVDWYTENFQCEVRYQDSTWALIKFANTRLALVVPDQHPAHVGILREDAERFGALSTHRDGSRSVYIQDPFGNAVELMVPAPSATLERSP